MALHPFAPTDFLLFTRAHRTVSMSAVLGLNVAAYAADIGGENISQVSGRHPGCGRASRAKNYLDSLSDRDHGCAVENLSYNAKIITNE